MQVVTSEDAIQKTKSAYYCHCNLMRGRKKATHVVYAGQCKTCSSETKLDAWSHDACTQDTLQTWPSYGHPLVVLFLFFTLASLSSSGMESPASPSTHNRRCKFGKFAHGFHNKHKNAGSSSWKHQCVRLCTPCPVCTLHTVHRNPSLNTKTWNFFMWKYQTPVFVLLCCVFL